VKNQHSLDNYLLTFFWIYQIAMQETIKIMQSNTNIQSQEAYKSAGRVKRPRNLDTIPTCFTTPKKSVENQLGGAIKKNRMKRKRQDVANSLRRSQAKPKVLSI